MLAYSTISQMGFITALPAVGLLVPELASATITAAVLYAVHHGLAKGAMFLGVPVMKHFGTGWTRWLVAAGLVGAGLAVAGAPLTSGAYGKYISKETVEGITFVGADLYDLLPLVATGSTVLLMRFGWLLWSAQRHRSTVPPGAGLMAAGLRCGHCCAVAGGHALVGRGSFSWEAGPLWDATWPLLLGLAVGSGVWLLSARGWLPGWVERADGTALQPGDLVVAEESVGARTAQGAASVLEGAHQGATTVRESTLGLVTRWAYRAEQAVDGGERRLAPWAASGAAVLVVLTGSLLLLAGGGCCEVCGVGCSAGLLLALVWVALAGFASDYAIYGVVSVAAGTALSLVLLPPRRDSGVLVGSGACGVRCFWRGGSCGSRRGVVWMWPGGLWRGCRILIRR